MQHFKLSAKQISEWRDNETTRAVFNAATAWLDAQEAAAKEAYWAGRPVDEPHRLALRMHRQFVQELMTGEIEETEDEPERD